MGGLFKKLREMLSGLFGSGQRDLGPEDGPPASAEREPESQLPSPLEAGAPDDMGQLLNWRSLPNQPVLPSNRPVPKRQAAASDVQEGQQLPTEASGPPNSEPETAADPEAQEPPAEPPVPAGQDELDEATQEQPADESLFVTDREEPWTEEPATDNDSPFLPEGERHATREQNVYREAQERRRTRFQEGLRRRQAQSRPYPGAAEPVKPDPAEQQKPPGRFRPAPEIRHSPKAVGDAARAHQRARREQESQRKAVAPQQAEPAAVETFDVPDEEGLRFDRAPSSMRTTPSDRPPEMPSSAVEISEAQASAIQARQFDSTLRQAPGGAQGETAQADSQSRDSQGEIRHMLQQILTAIGQVDGRLTQIEQRLSETRGLA